ncbi:MAG: conjugal transfer protein TraC [Alicyclobacillus sp.]|nr:conjugal transfer protein TraC [Alicyclobacillus sp.]
MGNPIIEAVTPAGVGFQPNHLYFGDQYGKVLLVTNYPPRVGIGWLSRVGQIPGVVLSVHTTPTDPTALIKQINISIGELGARLEQGSNALVRQRTEQALQDAQTLLRTIDQEQQQVYYVTVTILVLAATQEELSRRVNRVQSSAAAQGMRARVLTFAQEQGLRATSPWAELPVDVPGQRNMPAETIAAMLPFTKHGLNTGTGVIIGRDADSGLVLLDHWGSEGANTTNANMAVLGIPGGGKSYSVKVEMLRHYAQGVQFIVVDPEREYGGICESLGGDWIDTTGDGGRINPLQVLPLLDESATSGSTTRGPLASHLQFFRGFIAAYLQDLTQTEMAALEEAVTEVYKTHGIDWHTDPSTVEKWPTMADLYEYLQTHYEDSRLPLLLRSAAVGADAAIWQGQTTVTTNSDLTVLDIYGLRDAADNVKRAQYYLTTYYAWYLVRRARSSSRHIVMVIDEAYLLIDERNPATLQFVFEVAKRIRKYGPPPIGAGLWLITQNVSDFLSGSAKSYGEAIFGTCDYKLLMRLGERDLERLIPLLKLSEAEQTLLTNAKRGEGLLLAGRDRVRLKTEATELEHRIITGGDG